MATVHRETEIARDRGFVWDAIRDVGAIHERLVPGFVVDCKFEGDSRIVTFGNGMVVRELIVAVDDRTWRHAWSARGEPFTHHNASIQVFAEGNGTSRVVWIADVMPDEVADTVGEMMSQALAVMKRTLETARTAPKRERESSGNSGAEEELLVLAHAWDRAMVGNDAEAIGQYMAHDWTIIGSDGGVGDRATFLGLVKSGALSHDVMESEDVKIRVYGDTAVITARGVSGGKYQGQAFREVERATCVFVRRDGRWRCVLTHLSRIAPEPAR